MNLKEFVDEQFIWEILPYDGKCAYMKESDKAASKIYFATSNQNCNAAGILIANTLF